MPHALDLVVFRTTRWTLTKKCSRGVELLRLYLKFATSQGADCGETQNDSIQSNAFEADIERELSAKGIQLIPQWGVGKLRIDFVAKHPEKAWPIRLGH